MPSGTDTWRMVRGRLLPAALLLASLAPTADAQSPGDWSQFRFGTRHLGGNSSETVLSPSNVAALVRRWSTPIGRTIFSSASVVGGRVYVGTLDGRVYALDAASGAVLWARPSDAITGDTVWSTPAVVKGAVYFAANRPFGIVYAIDAATGATLWTAAPTLSIIVASPVVTEGAVYLALNDHSVISLDAETGATLWTANAGAGMYASPAVAEGRLYVTVHNRGLLALNARTGAQLWLAPMPGPQWSSPAAAKGRVFVGSRDDQRVYAFDSATGATLWTAPLGAWVHTSPSFAGNVVYAGANDGKLYALDALTGRLLWSRQLAPTGGIFGGPTVANGVVYATSGQGDGKLYAVSAADGQVLFSDFVGDGDQSGDGEWVNASATVAGGAVYVGTYEGDDSVVTKFALPTSDERP